MDQIEIVPIEFPTENSQETSKNSEPEIKEILENSEISKEYPDNLSYKTNIGM